jgi:hypothetical protein
MGRGFHSLGAHRCSPRASVEAKDQAAADGKEAEGRTWGKGVTSRISTSRASPGLRIVSPIFSNDAHQAIRDPLGCFDGDRPGEIVDLGQVNVAHVIRIVRVSDLSTCAGRKR